MKKTNARILAVDILERSNCSVQVGASIEDNTGIISWGWNGMGFDGCGLHAEAHAILRANKKRLTGSTIYIASLRNRNRRIIISKPCDVCQKLINKWKLKAVWRDYNGEWIDEHG